MQTGTAKGMMTMEQALAELVQKKVVAVDVALSRSSRPDQLIGILERVGFDLSVLEPEEVPAPPLAPLGGLRVAEA
jgi:hypothetical protein